MMKISWDGSYSLIVRHVCTNKKYIELLLVLSLYAPSEPLLCQGTSPVGVRQPQFVNVDTSAPS